MGTVKNLSYFNSEANKNRDMWKHADSGSTAYDCKTDSLNLNLYATGKFDDIIRYQAPKRLWQNAIDEKRILRILNAPSLRADGEGDVETENEDSVDSEGEELDSTVVDDGTAQMSADEIPKFRQLVRAKKLDYKAQYGKAHAGSRQECHMIDVPDICYKRVCLGGLVDIPRDGKGPIWKSDINCNDHTPYPCTKKQNICITIPTWTWGWRKRWREFKQAGGLSKLKMISRGMLPLTPSTETPTTAPTVNPSKSGTRRKTGEIVNVGSPKLEVVNGTSQAGFGKNIIGIVLALGLVFAGIKMMK